MFLRALLQFIADPTSCVLALVKPATGNLESHKIGPPNLRSGLADFPGHKSTPKNLQAVNLGYNLSIQQPLPIIEETKSNPLRSL